MSGNWQSLQQFAKNVILQKKSSNQNQNHWKIDFKSKSQIMFKKVISNQNHKSKKWFQITISNQLISNHSHHC